MTTNFMRLARLCRSLQEQCDELHGKIDLLERKRNLLEGRIEGLQKALTKCQPPKQYKRKVGNFHQMIGSLLTDPSDRELFGLEQTDAHLNQNTPLVVMLPDNSVVFL